MVEKADARSAEEVIPGTDPAGPTAGPTTEPKVEGNHVG